MWKCKFPKLFVERAGHASLLMVLEQKQAKKQLVESLLPRRSRRSKACDEKYRQS